MNDLRDRRWRYPWQVVRYYPDGGLTVRCSHRWEWTASLCSDWQDRIFVVSRRADGSWHEDRRNPYAEESTNV